MRIGVLAARAGITAKTIRFYEDAGLMPAPARTPAGYRDYPAGAAARLAFIRDAQAAGLTLAEIRGILVIRDNDQAPCQHVTDLIDQHLAQVSQRLAELTQARDALRALKSRASATDPGDCPQDQVCSILSMTPGGNPVAVHDGRAVSILAAGRRDGEPDRGRAGLAAGVAVPG